MFATSLQSIKLLQPSFRVKYLTLVGARAVIGLFDLVAVLLLGALVSLVAMYSAPNTVQQNSLLKLFMGDLLSPPSIKQIALLACFSIFFFSLKAFLAVLLNKETTNFLATCEIFATSQIAQELSARKLKGLESIGSTELIYAMKRGTNAAFGGLLQNVATLIAELFLFICLTIVFLFVSPVTTLLLLLVMSGIGLYMHFNVSKKIQHNSQKATYSSQEFDNNVNDLVFGFREIYAAGAMDKFLAKLSKSRETFARVEANQVFLHSLPRYIIETAVIFIVLAIGLVQVVNVNISETAPTLGVFLAGGMRIVAAMVPLQAAIGQLRHFAPEANEAFKLFGKLGISTIKRTTPPKQTVKSNKLLKPVDLKFHNVSFSYGEDDKFSLHSINIDIAAGEHVALVGRSGSGKSTLADLALGLLQPQIGNIEIASLKADRFVERNQGRVSYVPQRPSKFPGDFIDNVALGVPRDKVNLNKVLECLEIANLIDYVESLPESFRSNLSETKLSGGQLQRLGLARALYTNPQVLVLDEITSSLDAESERYIAQSLENLKGKISTLIIAHRISTIRTASKIYVLEQGRIIESGDFSQLSKSGQQFRKFLDTKRQV